MEKQGKEPSEDSYSVLTADLEYNADLNGAINLGKRFEGYTPSDGATLDTALNFGVMNYGL